MKTGKRDKYESWQIRNLTNGKQEMGKWEMGNVRNEQREQTRKNKKWKEIRDARIGKR